MSGLKQGIDVWMEVADRLPELQDLDVSEMADFRGRCLADKILGNSDIEADYSALTLYRCMLLSPIENALEIGTYNFAHTGRILSNIKADLSLSNVNIQGQSLEEHRAKLRNIRVTHSRIENYTFKECTFENCDFRGSRFVNVKFICCEIYDSSFEGCTFDNCVFDGLDDGGVWREFEVMGGCNFQNTRFFTTKLDWAFNEDIGIDECKLMFEGSNIAPHNLPRI